MVRDCSKRAILRRRGYANAKHIKALHAKGKRLLTPEQRVQILAERLKSLGVDPHSLV
jgi:hypothetical protein